MASEMWGYCFQGISFLLYIGTTIPLDTKWTIKKISKFWISFLIKLLLYSF